MPNIYIDNARYSLRHPPRAAAALVLGMFTLSLLAPTPLIASSWNPTLLVNTEAFQIVHEGDSAAGTDVELRFGDTLNERIYWDRTNSEFRFTDDIRVDGNITASGAFVIQNASRIKANLNVAGTVSGAVLYASSGINSSGAVIIKTPITTSAILGGTGALVVMQRIELGTGAYMSASGAAILALDSPVQSTGLNGQASTTPHIVFGYRGAFDTNLYRLTGSTLATDDALKVGGNITTQSTFTGSVLRVMSGANSYVLGNLGIGTAAPETKLEVVGTMSGKALSVTATEDSNFIQLFDSTWGDSASFLTGSGSPVAAVSAQLGSVYIDRYFGRIYAKADDDGANTGWNELAFSSGSYHMAKMQQTVAQNISHGTFTTIDFDTVTYDYGNIASTSTERFTIQKAGLYLITASWLTSSTLDAGEIGLSAIYKNGGLALQGRFQSGGTDKYVQSAVTSVLALAPADYITFIAYHDEGATITPYIAAGYYPEMSVVQLSAPPGADLAEVYYTHEPLLLPGAVVSIDPTLSAGVRRSARPYDPNVLGVVSLEPGLLLKDETHWQGGHPVQVALMGRVPVLVSTENGPIRPGDILTSSSIPGVAMKATDGGPTIGKALEAYRGGTVGMVMTFINNDSAAPDDASRRLRELEERTRALEERIMSRRE